MNNIFEKLKKGEVKAKNDFGCISLRAKVKQIVNWNEHNIFFYEDMNVRHKKLALRINARTK